MRSPMSRRAPLTGALLLALGLTACSSPTPNRPLDRAPAGTSDGAAAPASSGGYRNDPISGGPEVWDDLYGVPTEDPNAPYPPPPFAAEPTDSAYPPPRGGDAPAPSDAAGGEGDADGAGGAGSGDATAAPAEPTATPTPTR